MIELQNMGTTYSVVDPTIYDRFKSDGDAEIFEKLVMDLMLNKYSDDKELTEYILGLPKTKQRMAVLSVIDGDNVLWSKMNAYVNECSDKFEHIKDVVKIINQFVKDGEVEKKKFGEVMTPITLVREMLDTLPDDVWSNPNLKWLDPANGAGTFPFVVIYKLMNGLKYWEPDTEKRYKHIVEKMIYVCELQSRNVFLWLCGVDPRDEYTTNTYWGSFLDTDFDKHKKEVWGVDKFDIVIGNPPYQTENNSIVTKTSSNVKLWRIFIEKSFTLMETNGYLNFVTPSSWASGTKNPHNSTNLFSDIFNKKNTLFVSFDVNQYFNGIGVDFSYYLIQNSIYGGLTKFKCDSIISEVNLSNFNLLPRVINSKVFSILNKLLIVEKFEFKMDRRDHYKNSLQENLSDEFNIPVYCGPSKGILYSDKSSPYLKCPKIFTHRISTLKMIDDQNAKISTNYSQVYLLKDKEIGKNACNLFSTKFYNFLYKLFQYTQYNESITLNQLPKVDLSLEWDDERLFEYFGITNEEKEIINKY